MKSKDKYDRQLVVQFLTGVGDETILNSSEALSEAFIELKGGERVAAIGTVQLGVEPGTGQYWAPLTERMAKMTAQSRIYLNGHGDWKSQTLGGFTPKQVAQILVSAGLTNVQTICITACGLGRERASGLVFTSVSSFASKFHLRLNEKHNIKCEVHAYTTDMGVFGPNNAKKLMAKTANAELLFGRKYQDVFGEATWHAPYSKRILTWAGDKQQLSWAYE